MLLTVNFAFLHQQLLQPVVQARDAKRPFPQCAQKLVFAKCGDDLPGLTALLHAAQKMLVSLKSLLKHSLILFPALQRFLFNVSEGTVKHRARGVPVATVDRRSQLADAGVATETVAFLQQAQAVTQCARDRRVIGFKRATGQTGELLRPRGGITVTGVGTDIPQHRPGFYRGELIAIAQENHARMGWQRIDQARHHGQVDHGGFIHHQHVQMQRIARMVAQPLATRLRAEQTVQSTCFTREKRKLLLGERQPLHRTAQ
ncbi:Uncharacterised protein [Enterobacter cloacae]|nr:Uncharacterised protein [Enterobacter cloacae]